MSTGLFGGTNIEIEACKQLTLMGHKITFVSQNYVDNPSFNRVITQNLNAPSNQIDISSITEDEPDVIFASSVSGASLANRLRERLKVPSVVMLLDVPMWRIPYSPWRDKWLNDWLPNLAKSSYVVGHTTQALTDAVQLYPPLDTVLKSVNGFGIIQPSFDLEKMKKEIQTEENTCISAHRLVFQKGTQFVLAAMSLMKNPPSYHLIGEGDDAVNLAFLAQMFNIGTNVHFYGEVSEQKKYELILKSSFGILVEQTPSIASLFPLEAMLCGKPVIVSNTVINRERFGPHATYIDGRNTMGVALEMENMLEWTVHNENYKTIMPKWVMENRSMAVHARRLAEIFMTVLVC